MQKLVACLVIQGHRCGNLFNGRRIACKRCLKSALEGQCEICSELEPHQCQARFLSKVKSMQSATLLKNDLNLDASLISQLLTSKVQKMLFKSLEAYNLLILFIVNFEQVFDSCESRQLQPVFSQIFEFFMFVSSLPCSLRFLCLCEITNLVNI